MRSTKQSTEEFIQNLDDYASRDNSTERQKRRFTLLPNFQTTNTLTSLFSFKTKAGAEEMKKLREKCKIFSQKSHQLVSKRELKILKEGFNKLDTQTNKTPNKITRDEFREGLGILGHNHIFSDILFNAFDKDKNGEIDFSEFLSSILILTKGNPEEKLEFAFNMLDVDGDGKITREELKTVIKSMQNTLRSVDLSEKFPENYSDLLFNSLDLDHDGVITMEEYKLGVLKNPNLIKGLGVFGTDIEDNLLNKSVNTGKTVSFGTQRWDQVMNMMMGIRMVGELIGEIKRDIKREDFSVQLQFTLPQIKEGEKKIFVDYAPMVFRDIRRTFGITEETYMYSLGPEQLLGNLLLGNLSTFSEKITDGKSGSFFFFSNDGKYLVKTLPEREVKTFLEILPAYYSYLKSNPDTLLVRFFGLHELDGLQFVVMGNVFSETSVEIHEIYDLKGSTHKRTSTGFVKKDLDLKRKFRFGQEIRESIIDCLIRDSEFLASLNLIDYSLIVGIHNPTEEVPDSKGLEKLTKKIISPYDKNEIYYLGIIDMLTVYDTKKEVEHVVKSFTTSLTIDSEKISAIPPVPYARRFVKFLSSVIE